MKLRVHLDVADPVTRRRLAALVKADPEIVLVNEAEEADVVVSERVIATAAPATLPQKASPSRRASGMCCASSRRAWATRKLRRSSISPRIR